MTIEFLDMVIDGFLPPSTHVQNIRLSVVMIHDVDDVAIRCSDEEPP